MSGTVTVSDRSGVFRQWWANGRLKSEGLFREDLREGTWTFWDVAGRKCSEGNYQRGVRRGEWTVYEAADDTPHLVWYVDGHAIPNRDVLLARLAQKLQSGDRDARFDAVEALGQLGAAAAPILLASLSKDDAPLSLGALRALVEIGADARSALSAIATLSSTSDRDLHRESLVALFIIDEPNRNRRFRDLLLESDLSDALASRAWHVRLGAFRESVVTPLERALEDANVEVRLRALDVLAGMFDSEYETLFDMDYPPESFRERFIKLLEKAQRDKEPSIHRAAKEMLEIRRRMQAELQWFLANPVVG